MSVCMCIWRQIACCSCLLIEHCSAWHAELGARRADKFVCVCMFELACKVQAHVRVVCSMYIINTAYKARRTHVLLWLVQYINTHAHSHTDHATICSDCAHSRNQHRDNCTRAAFTSLSRFERTGICIFWHSIGTGKRGSRPENYAPNHIQTASCQTVL